MYKGFNLKISFSEKDVNTFYKIGKSLFDKEQIFIRTSLEELLLTNGNIDGSKMQENWFPQVKSNIFISHSHNDERNAITLAGWLYKTFELESFIDSCIWGYSNELLKMIDKKYCLQDDGYYSYSRRNFSTSHVHMMLTTALNMMIDNTECLFFLNTPNSISTSSVINKTESPWIYSEITMSKLVRKRKLSEYRPRETRLFSKGGVLGINESFEYVLDLNHLTEIKPADLIKWQDEYNNEKFALDILYKQHSQSTIIGGKL
jgi:hypothetical protein